MSKFKSFKVKVYQDEKALEKMGIKSIETPNDEVKEQLVTIRRHLKGALAQIEKTLITPKCQKCYDLYGFVTKCVCENNS